MLLVWGLGGGVAAINPVHGVAYSGDQFCLPILDGPTLLKERGLTMAEKVPPS